MGFIYGSDWCSGLVFVIFLVNFLPINFIKNKNSGIFIFFPFNFLTLICYEFFPHIHPYGLGKSRFWISLYYWNSFFQPLKIILPNLSYKYPNVFRQIINA